MPPRASPFLVDGLQSDGDPAGRSATVRSTTAQRLPLLSLIFCRLSGFPVVRLSGFVEVK